MRSSDESMQRIVLELGSIRKEYGRNIVLKDISLHLRAGECIGLVGENGAGKSTLVGIISGKTQPTSGTITREGVEQQFRTPRDARRQGIQIIPQELAYVPELSVAENLMLSNWTDRGWALTQGRIREMARDALARLGFELDVSKRMIELSLAERQLVEIAKALIGDARILILDEPTSSLHENEAELLLQRLHRLKDDGVSLVYVSHHLNETFDVSDRVAVLRNGDLVSLTETRETTIEATVSQMLGGALKATAAASPPAEATDEAAALELTDWSYDRAPSLRSCSFALRRGEILGLFGLVGSGAETIAKALGGTLKGVRGDLIVADAAQKIPRSPSQAKKLGIAYVPAERKTEGLALEQPIAEHLTLGILPSLSSGAGVIRRKRQDARALAIADDMAVKRSAVRQNVGELSGGNQQKVLVGSRLVMEPDILVLHEPTRGVDIGSRGAIHEKLRLYAKAGHAVLVVTSDVQEAIDATDRLLVFRDGRIVSSLSGDRKTKSAALSIAAGGPSAG